MARLSLVTAPTAEPVTLDEAKDHLRVDINDDDTLISQRVTALRELFEEMYGIAILQQTWDWYLDDFPSTAFTVPRWPLSSITSIKYTDEDDVEATYSSANYRVDTVSKPGRVVLKTASSWPSVTLKEINGVVIRFVAGYSNQSSVPEYIKNALLLFVGDLYELREDTIVSERARVSAQRLGIAQLLMMNHREFNF